MRSLFGSESSNWKPDDPTVRVSLGWALGQTGQFREALHANEAVLKLTPDFAPAYYNIGLFAKSETLTGTAYTVPVSHRQG